MGRAAELRRQGLHLLDPVDADGHGRRHHPRHLSGLDAPVGQALARRARHALRGHLALDPAGDGDPVVLPADPLPDRTAGRREVGPDHLHAVRGHLFLRDHAGRHPVRLAGPGLRWLRGGHDLPPDHAVGGAAAGLPQHAAGAADADHRAVPGHLAGLCRRRLRPAEGLRIAGRNFNRPVETYLVAALVYLVICFSLSMLVRRLQKKIAIIR